MPTKVPQICRIGSLRSWTSSAAFITCPSLQSSKICPTLLTHPLIDWHCHLLSCLGQLTRWLKHPPNLSQLKRSKVCPFLQMHVWVVKWKGNALSIPIRWHCQKKQASATIKYIHDFFNFKGVTHSGIIVTIAQLVVAREAQIIFPRNPAATICVVAQQLLFTSCDSKTCPMFTSLGKCHICSPRGKFCVSVYLTINLKLPTVRTGDPPPFSCVMDINSANLNLNLWEKKNWNENMPS